ncbi:LANO_0H05710g1_1 [Lachancea nothofagi CBS 11611]|uniref:LANO_0H05710g1_1 n=1 Tax=Lachancea nothofagi CBS 11611 TaxID=1266666 RepID=A0A1G4KLQ8_9SACH|nr:LANO_0H05710g1_1 [Lachancea nothofagi CBS 11611]
MSIGLGAAIYAAVKPVLKIYLIIFVGFLLAKYNLATVETSRGVSNMVVNAILPCLTFNKIVGNISAKDIKEVGVLVLTAFLIFVTGGACAYLTKVVTKSPRQWYWGLLFAGTFPNISDLPIAYVQSMSNGSIFTSDQVDRGVAYCCIFLCTQSFLMMNFGMFRLVGLDFREAKKDEEQQLDNSESNSTEEERKTAKTQKSSSKSWRRSRSSDSDKAKMSMSHHKNEAGSSQSLSSDALSNENCSNEQCENPHHFVAPFETTSSLSSTSEYGTDILPPIESRGSRLSRGYDQFVAPTSATESLHKVSSTRSRSSKLSTNVDGKRRGRPRRQSQSMNDVINEYSVASRIKSGEMDLTRPLSLTQEVGEENAFTRDEIENSDLERGVTHSSHLEGPLCANLSRTATNRSQNAPSKFSMFVDKYKLGWLVYILINFCRPASLGALLGIICSMIPWVKALFVHTYVHVHQAPDGQPVLNFLMDFTGYIGNACVPLGLLLLGGTLARLEVKSLPPGFWKTTLMMTVLRLAILPIIGIAWANKLYNINWIDNEIAKFVVILTWAMPSATAQVYFTAFYTPLDGDHTQMDCLSVFFLSQYAVLFITLSVVVSYALKADLKV